MGMRVAAARTTIARLLRAKVVVNDPLRASATQARYFNAQGGSRGLDFAPSRSVAQCLWFSSVHRHRGLDDEVRPSDTRRSRPEREQVSTPYSDQKLGRDDG